MAANKILLAVFGRGSQRKCPGGPYVLTEDFETWNLQIGRSPVLTNRDDDNENCVIGGGKLNLAAGIALYKKLDPEVVVFAYGDNAPHLGTEGTPSESRVMSEMFFDAIQFETELLPRVDVFEPKFWGTDGKGSGTFHEVKNIFRLAQLRELDEIVIVTVLAHMSRVLGMVAEHLKDPEFADLRNRVRFEVTESVLLQADPESYAGRVWEIFGSQAFIRNLQRETFGLWALRKGITQTTQPGIVTTGVGQ